MMNFGIDETNPLFDDYWVPMGLTPSSQPRMDDAALEEAEKRLRLSDYGQRT
jgi:hypothetical protein